MNMAIYDTSSQFFKSLGARIMIQRSSVMRTHNCGATCECRRYLTLVNWHTFWYGREETAVIVLEC